MEAVLEGLDQGVANCCTATLAEGGSVRPSSSLSLTLLEEVCCKVVGLDADRDRVSGVSGAIPP